MAGFGRGSLLTEPSVNTSPPETENPAEAFASAGSVYLTIISLPMLLDRGAVGRDFEVAADGAVRRVVGGLSGVSPHY